MLNVKTIEWSDLLLLNQMGAFVKYGWEEPQTHRKQSRARRALEKRFADQITAFPDEIRSYFSAQTSDSDLLAFLYACLDEVSLRYRENRTPQALVLEPLGKEMQHALMAFIEDEDECFELMEKWPVSLREDGKIALRVVNQQAYAQTVVLENASMELDFSEYPYLMPGQIRREGDMYILSAFAEDAEVDALRFTGGTVETTYYDCTKEPAVFSASPWDMLRAIAWQIQSKAELPGDHCNQLEKELLPLMSEIRLMGSPKKEQKFPCLLELASQCGYDVPKLAKKLGRLRYLALETQLNNCEYETLWRVIYERICQSQKAYPTKLELQEDQSEVEQLKRQITELFHGQGFLGDYPDFYKTGDLSGLHLVEVQNQPYICGMEKNARMHIHCFPSQWWDGPIHMSYLCGIAFQKASTSVKDAFGCLFRDRGQRLGWWVYDFVSGTVPKGRNLQLAKIAAKKVQMQKLTKEERALTSFGSTKPLPLFFQWFFLSGTLFANLMVAAFMAMGALILAVFGHGHEIVELLGEFPWTVMWLSCWLGFGLPMGIISILAKRK